MWFFWLIITAMIWTMTSVLVRSAIYHGRRPSIMRRAQGNDLTDVAGEIHGETEKAFKFFDGVTTVWLPKSQCEWDATDKTMTMPEWLALEKGLI